MRNIALLLLATAAAFGQTAPVATVGAGGSPALIRFQITPQKGKPVTDLRPEDIEIREDGVTREVVLLEGGTGRPRTIPTEISLLIDCSRAELASGKLDERVFKEFLDEFPHLSIAVYGFASGPTRLAARTRNQADLIKALSPQLFTHPLSTSLMDHISRVLIDAASSPGRALRILSVFSTGQTDQGTSYATREQERYDRVVSIAQQTGISVYPVLLITQLTTQDATPGAAPLQRETTVPGPKQTLFSDISASTRLRMVGNFVNLGSATGGKKIEVVTGGNMLPTVLRWLAEQLRNEYVVAFQPAASEEKRRHNIEVVLRSKDRGEINGGSQSLVY